MSTSLPDHESERLQALRRYSILDTPPEGSFDQITAVAAELFRVPIALIGLVDHDRIWFKSRHGFEVQQIPRDPGFCASAIFSPDAYHLRDALSDPRTLSNPLVQGESGLRFYAAAPLRTHDGFNLGTLCVIDRKPRDLSDAERAMLMKLAAIVIDQMELRLSVRRMADVEESERQMAERLRESEERFRDLFDEAPIAYVHEGLDSRFIRVNRTAMRILGINPEDVAGSYGVSFVPDTPEAQARVRQALESIGRGTDTSGVVLELRRKDSGKPVWIQWWSRPDPGGAYTRTMFLDITERVLMEQEQARLKTQNAYLQEEIRSEHNFGEIVGKSPALLEVLRQVEQVGPTDSAVLISGETGTGKELIARAIHDRSTRRDRALVKVNCAAISAGLVESELFGHVKGAFTGALMNRDGRFKVADGGTIFLDEIGELPLDMQVKLLRVLQEQEFEPVGSSASIRVDVRVIAATNRDLEEAVRVGRFRADLFYRLNVIPIMVPPLRARTSDIRQLVMFFLSRYSQRFGRKATSVSEETMDRLIHYSWPGNIRELQNVIERAVVVSGGAVLELDGELGPVAVDGHRPAVRSGSQPPPRFASLEEVERNHIVTILDQTRWVIEGPKGAAQVLKLHPNTLRSRMEKLGIKRARRNG
jgi:formate hydrogenlyase transcriptional activator